MKKIRNYLIFPLVVFSSLCANSFSEQWRWKNDGVDGSWTDSGVWESSSLGITWSDSDSYPDSSSDTVYLRGTSDTVITIPAGKNISVGYLAMNTDASSGNVTITVNGSLSVNYLYTNYKDGSSGNSTLEINGEASVTNFRVKMKGTEKNDSSTSTGKAYVSIASGKTLTVTNFCMAAGNTAKANTYIGLAGAGTLEASKFDFPENYTHEVNISSGSTFKITGSFMGDSNTAGNMKFTGSGNLYVPASGADMGYGEIIGPSYASTLKIYPYGTPSYYTVSVSGLNGFSESSPVSIEVTRVVDSANRKATVHYPYEIIDVTSTATAVFSFNGTDGISSGDTGTLDLDKNTGSDTFEISVSDGMAENDGFKIKILTPDKSRVLAEVEWYKGKLIWTGSASSAWENEDNWSGLEAGKTLAENLEGKDIVINYAVSNMPSVSSGTYSIASLEVKSNASVNLTGGNLSCDVLTLADSSGRAVISQSGGTLTLKEAHINGNSSFASTSGTVVMAGSAPVLDANKNDSAEFYNLTIESGATFSPAKTITVKGSLENNGNFNPTGVCSVAGKLLNYGKAAFNQLDFTGTQIVFGDDSSDTFKISSNAFSVSAGITVKAAGRLTFTKGFSCSSAIDLTADTTVIVPSSYKAVFSGEVNSATSGESKLVLGNSSNPTECTFEAGIGKSRELKSFTQGTGVIEFSAGAVVNTKREQNYNANVNAAGALSLKTSSSSNGKIIIKGGTITTGGSFTVINAGMFDLQGDALITVSSGMFTQTGNGSIQCAGNITSTNGISFRKDAYLYSSTGAGETSMTLNASSGASSSSVPKINAGGTLYIAAASSKEIILMSPVNAVNFVLAGGKVSPDASGSQCTGITATKDIVLFGSNYSEDDTGTGGSGVTGLFKYNHALRTSDNLCATVNATIQSKRPDGTSISYNAGSFTSLSGKTLSAGKNFYANGIDLNGGAEGWTLTILNTNNAKQCFAEMYNLTVSGCSASYFVSAAEGCTDGSGNTNIDFSRPVIAANDSSKATQTGGSAVETSNLSGTYTLFDDIIRIEFKDSVTGASKKIENTNNEISKAIENAGIKFSGGSYNFSSAYIDANCTVSTDGKGDLSVFYLKASRKWNTDATGSSIGNADSSDTTAAHSELKPDIYLPKALSTLYASLRDEHKNRVAHYASSPAGSSLFTGTADRTPPSLVAVRLGQELHDSNLSSQKAYDAHNFIELQYSEPVDLGALLHDGSGYVNLTPQASFTSSSNYGGLISNDATGFSIAGYCSISKGAVHTGSRTKENSVTSENLNVNSLYRNFSITPGGTEAVQPCRLRISVAGYKDGTVNVNGTSLNWWPGFIRNTTVSPEGGIVTRTENNFIIAAGYGGPSSENHLAVSGSGSRVLPSITVDAEESGLFGPWDLSPPSVAHYIKETQWSESHPFKEILPVDLTNAGYVNSFELHILDNTPAYSASDAYQWYTREGWYAGSSKMSVVSGEPLDFRGGSKMQDGTNKTNGGLRTSSLYNSIGAFSYRDNTTNYDGNVTGEFYQKTTVASFFGDSGSLEYDIPYIGLKITGRSSDITSDDYLISYRGNAQQNGFVTDLAGNLLADFVNFEAPDKNPPKFSLSIAPLDSSKIYILFSKRINYKSTGAEEKIVRSLRLVDSSDNDTNLIDWDNGSRILTGKTTDTARATGFVITLANDACLTYEQIKTLKLKVNTFPGMDPVTGGSGNFSQIYDWYDNPVPAADSHRITDFAVNVIDVNYAYDGRNSDTAMLGKNLITPDEWTVRDFSGSGLNTTKVLSEKDVSVVCSVNKNAAGTIADEIEMRLDINPTSGCNGDNFTLNSGIKTRLWINDMLEPFSTIANTSSSCKALLPESWSGTNDNGIRHFIIPNSPTTNGAYLWPVGSEIQFTFKINDSTLSEPLYAARLKDSSDITSIDLWSMEIASVTKQRGGVTILNNVIDVNTREKCTVLVDMPKSGRLNVIVMTLDGSIVKYLCNGNVEAGERLFYWDGTNKSGTPVARGLYFVRVVGPDIDETRKVMCVKE